jgi:hypothetical protein
MLVSCRCWCNQQSSKAGGVCCLGMFGVCCLLFRYADLGLKIWDNELLITNHKLTMVQVSELDEDFRRGQRPSPTDKEHFIIKK